MVRRQLGAIDGQVALRLVAQQPQKWTFESIQKPFSLGNAGNIAYGGYVASMAIAAAYQSLSQDALTHQRIYSVAGNYLGPTSTDSTVTLEVSVLRQTKSFSTRLVLAKQRSSSNDVERTTAAVLIDFIATRGTQTEPGMRYSAQPRKDVSHHSRLRSWHGTLDDEVKAGTLPESVRDFVKEIGAPMAALIEQSFCPEGIFFDTLGAIMPDRKSKQDNLAITDKVAYEWFRHRTVDGSSDDAAKDGVLLPPTPQASAACMFGMVMDAYISFSPLSFSHKSLYSVQSCSTLDFALRFHIDDLQPHKWNLREITTIAGGDERTYTEARCWHDDDAQSGELTLAATMTQACVLRSRPENVSKL